MDGVLAEPNSFASIASCLCPHRVASLEQVSPALKVYAEACGIWGKCGSMAWQVQNALETILRPSAYGSYNAHVFGLSVFGVLHRASGSLVFSPDTDQKTRPCRASTVLLFGGRSRGWHTMKLRCQKAHDWGSISRDRYLPFQRKGRRRRRRRRRR